MPNINTRPIRTALLSVTDKTNLLGLAKVLAAQGVILLASDGTAKYLISEGITATPISEYTGFPEILGGRVKTLHPKIHAGLLARGEQDEATLKAHDILPIDLLVANLYDFESYKEKGGLDAIEHIDIGGVALLRAAAKNFTFTAVLSHPEQYAEFLELFAKTQGTALAHRQKWAGAAFQVTASLDRSISTYFNQALFPEALNLGFVKTADLRYGENPHQQAAAYRSLQSPPTGVLSSTQWQGKPLSFNNLLDADAAFRMVQVFEEPTVVIVKHNNPCGVASDTSAIKAYSRAFQADPVSAFGGVVACNRPLTAELFKTILEQQFVEVILAFGVDRMQEEAIKKLGATKPNVRLLILEERFQRLSEETVLDFKSIQGGLLVQEQDRTLLLPEKLEIPTIRQPTAAEWRDLHFAWKVCRFVKSNAIVYAKHETTLGIGAGQMSRVASARIAHQQAQQLGHSLFESVMASDAFFPFRDSVEEAASVGVTAIIQPGGSVRDAEVIEAADHLGIAMVFTHVRHFCH